MIFFFVKSLTQKERRIGCRDVSWHSLVHVLGYTTYLLSIITGDPNEKRIPLTIQQY
jgi:hypothetical protein